MNSLIPTRRPSTTTTTGPAPKGGVDGEEEAEEEAAEQEDSEESGTDSEEEAAANAKKNARKIAGLNNNIDVTVIVGVSARMMLGHGQAAGDKIASERSTLIGLPSGVIDASLNENLGDIIESARASLQVYHAVCIS